MSKPIHKQLDAIVKMEEFAKIKKGILLEKAMYSSNPNDVIRASTIASANIEPREEGERKSYIVDPLQFNQFLGYKNKPYSLSYNMLRRVSYAVPIVRGVIGTRLDQITSFCEPQRDKYSTGFVIRKKKGFYGGTDKDKEPTTEELKKCEELTEFILNCGVGNNFDCDDFDTFTRKVMNDSYMYDQLAFEIVRNRRGVPVNFYAVDASTIRIADSFDVDSYGRDYNNTTAREKIKGYYPTYCQIENGSVTNDFYPWEMCFGVRNPVTDIYSNGYGVCEIEILMNVITSMLWGDEYNRRFFSQGSAPKGFLKVKNGSLVNSPKIGEFKQAWQNLMAGVHNSHRTAILEGDVEWEDLQHTNREMEFSKWMEYLIKLACAIFRIDPAEINFPLGGEADKKAMFEGNNEARLKHSKDKGLFPVLKFFQRKINKYLIQQIAPDYEFSFVGMDGADIGTELDQDIKMVTNFMTVDEVRVRRGMKPMGANNGGNVILNAVMQQNLNAKMMQETQEKMMKQQGFAGKQPLTNANENDEAEEKTDPFEKAFNDYLLTLQKAA